MQNIKEQLANIASISGNPRTYATNAPAQYSDKQHEYFADPTRAFVKKYAKYASDYVSAQVQGLNAADPQVWETYNIRMSDAIMRTSMLARKIDDFKFVIFDDPSVNYVPEGTKINAMGSIWLAINPGNVAGVHGNAIVRRCRATWNHYDEYGNILKEPLCIDKLLAGASESDPQDAGLITRGYFNVICQYNEWTSQLNTNSRIILGSGAYRITGYSDFTEEFTGDANTVRLLEFTVRYEEPNFEIDDMTNRIAGGKVDAISLEVFGNTELAVGDDAVQFDVHAYKGQNSAEYIDDSAWSYSWESSDPNVVSITEGGLASVISSGSSTIRATLNQNPNLYAEITVSAAQPPASPIVAFTSIVPKTLRAYESIALEAQYFDGTQWTNYTIQWNAEGADAWCFSAQEEGNTLTITAFSSSEKPVVVTATCNGASASVQISLEAI